MPYKIWIEIEEVNEEGDPINEDHDYSFALPFASSAYCTTYQEALDIGVAMHNAINPSHSQVEYVQLHKNEEVIP